MKLDALLEDAVAELRAVTGKQEIPTFGASEGTTRRTRRAAFGSSLSLGPSPLSGAVVAASTGAIVVMTFLVALSFIGLRNAPDEITDEVDVPEVVPSSVAPDVVPGPFATDTAPSPQPTFIEWQRVDLEGTPGVDLVARAIPLIDCDDPSFCGRPRGFVAVGSAPNGTDRSGMVWRSDDGITWELAALLGGGEGRVFVHDVAYRDGTVVAVGGIDPTGFGSGRKDDPYVPMIWISRDLGASWDLVASGSDLAAEHVDRVVRSVVAVDDGFVAGGPGGAWTSETGEEWIRRPVESDGLVDFEHLTAWSGGLLAWGDETPGEGWRQTLRVWVSADGVQWQERPTEGIVRDDQNWYLNAVVEAPQGGVLIAVGSGGRPPIWTSTDGADWDLVDVDLPTDAFGWVQQAYSATGFGKMVAVFGEYGARQDAVIRQGLTAVGWRTEDAGATWSVIETPSEVFGALSGASSSVSSASAFRDPITGEWFILLGGSYEQVDQDPSNRNNMNPAVWLGKVWEP